MTYHNDKKELLPKEIVIRTTDALFFGEKKACMAQA
jgi:hypothetical protein|tara:strand:+ start:11712 stop:11819 length:108 start_codon:yes stop_codon:yes gene_type:complete